MATISKRSGGRGGRAPISLSPNSQHGPLQKLGNEGIDFHHPPVAITPKSQQGPLQKLGNEGIEFRALKALNVKEMVSGFWLLSTPVRVLGFATQHSF